MSVINIGTKSYSFYELPATSGGFGLCGIGDSYQALVQLTSNPSFRLFDIPPEGGVNHWPELAALAARLNEAFEQEARRIIELARKEHRQEDLEITVYLSPKGFQLVYAVPVPRRTPVGIRAPFISRLVYRLRTLVGLRPKAHRGPA